MDKPGGRIVVGLDDSVGGRAALAHALHEADHRGAVVEAVVVVDVPQYWADVYAAPVLSADGVAQVRAAARRRMAAVVDEVRAAEAPTLGTSPHVELRVVGGAPTGALLDAAAGADLLVVGSRGRGRLARAMFGSVSLQVVLQARCPVTVVHPTAAAEPQPVG